MTRLSTAFVSSWPTCASHEWQFPIPGSEEPVENCPGLGNQVAEGLLMTQLKKVVEPFGEVNVYPSRAGKTRVVATILMEPHKEGAQTGIALDGSGSMAKLYGVQDGGGILSSIFGRPQAHNDVTPVAQQICAYLAR